MTTDAERAAEYAREIAAGSTLQQIGDRRGLTRERVRQILVTEPELYARARADRTKLRHEQVLAHAARTGSIREAAKLTGFSYNHTRDVVAKRDPGLLHRILTNDRLKDRNRGAIRRYSDEALEGWVRLFVMENEPPYSSLTWQRFLRANGGPATRTFVMRFGRWADLAERFGFAPVGARTGAPRSRRDCVNALLRIAAEYGGVVDSQDYDRLHHGGGQSRLGEPSEGTVRDLLGGGSWKNVVHWLYPRTDAPPVPRVVRIKSNNPE